MKNSITLVILVLLLWSCNHAPNDGQATSAKPQPIEFADAKYIGIGKQGLEELSKGNIDNFTDAMADNVTFKWNNGDSISGKANVNSYWKDRRTNVVDTIVYKNDIWLTVKINEAQKNVGPGTYLMGWFDTSVTYVNGKSIKLSIHNVYHFDANDKIDFVLQYLDRAPINAALATN